MAHFEKRTRIRAPSERLWAWHAAPGALERLTPPWEHVVVEDPGSGIQDGSQVRLRVGRPPFRQRWLAEHRDVQPGMGFVDVQIEGPFRRWHHEHRFEPDGDRAAWLVDRIDYDLPGGRLGAWIAGPFVHRKLERMFAWRHETTRQALEEDEDR